MFWYDLNGKYVTNIALHGHRDVEVQQVLDIPLEHYIDTATLIQMRRRWIRNA